MSQRQFALATGVSRGQVNAIESGRRVPSAALLDRLLGAADLDLMLCERVQGADFDALVAHLRRSLNHRLRLALGESVDLRAPVTGPHWRDLLTVAGHGQAVLCPPLAVRLWLPTGPATPVKVRVHGVRGQLPTLDVVETDRVDGALPPGLVPVSLRRGRRVWVHPPAELALDGTADQLRLADLLLHDRAPRDDAGRRRPAHRDPDEPAEATRLEFTKGSERIVIPDGTDGRGWRLDAPASLAQLLGPDGRLLG